MDSVYETLLNRLLEEVKNEDIKKRYQHCFISIYGLRVHEL